MAQRDAVVTLSGALDLATVDGVFGSLDREMDLLTSADTLILDVGRVDFFDSLALGLLIRVRNGCLVRGAGLIIRSMPDHGRRLIALSGLAALFTLDDSLSPGVRTLGAHLPAQVSLPAHPDPMFDQIASLVRRVVGTPTALVSLVDQTQQVFPGAVGLPDAWQQSRGTPLTHSFCQYVVAGQQPLVISDARKDVLLSHNGAIPDLGVVAYAGFPLTDVDGAVVGSLCAIDSVPRSWTDLELANLADLASACSSELQRRGAAHRAAVATERDRIARDLHGRVISDLFAVTLMLGQARAFTTGPADELVAGAMDSIDGSIATIRSTIFRPEALAEPLT